MLKYGDSVFFREVIIVGLPMFQCLTTREHTDSLGWTGLTTYERINRLAWTMWAMQKGNEILNAT